MGTTRNRLRGRTSPQLRGWLRRVAAVCSKLTAVRSAIDDCERPRRNGFRLSEDPQVELHDALLVMRLALAEILGEIAASGGTLQPGMAGRLFVTPAAETTAVP